jgi:hypothetical protein
VSSQRTGFKDMPFVKNYLKKICKNNRVNVYFAAEAGRRIRTMIWGLQEFPVTRSEEDWHSTAFPGKVLRIRSQQSY